MPRFLELILAWLLKRTLHPTVVTARDTAACVVQFVGYRPAPLAISATRRHAQWARFNKPPRLPRS